MLPKPRSQPAPSASFVRAAVARPIGRDEDVAQVLMLVHRHRVVTLIGPPGVGKSTLGRAVLDALVDEGVDAAHVALGDARELPALDASQLVLLDDCERLVAEAAGAVQASPRVRFLVTSRELLGVPGERAYEVQPLSPPDAIALIEERAGRRFEDDERADVARLAARLEGLPLPLELAANRLGVMTATELLTRLGDPLAVLAMPLRGGSARAHSMLGALDVSWRSLPPPARSALAQLATFRGPFAASDAERVVELPGGPPVIDVTRTLRDRSLLRVVEGPRLALYDVVRSFAERAEPELVRDAHARHAAWVLEGPPRAWSEVAAVHERAMAGLVPGGTETAARAIVSLGSRIWAEAPLHDVLRLLDGLGVSLLPPALAARVLLVRARARELAGRADAALDAEAARASASGDPELAALAETALGSLDIRAGAFASATRRLLAAANVLTPVAPAAAGDAFNYLGTALRAQERHDEARTALERALDLHRTAGDGRGEARDLAALAALAFQVGRTGDAQTLFARARTLAVEIGDVHARAYAEGMLAVVATELRQYEAAREHFSSADARLAALGEHRLRAVLTGYWAVLDQLEGATADARSRYARAIRDLEDQAERPLLALFRGAAATLAFAEDDVARGRALLARADGDATGEALRAVHRLCSAHEVLVQRRAALGRGDDRAARVALDAVLRVRSAALPIAQRHDEARLALRLLDVATGTDDAQPDEGELQVGEGGLWFRIGTSPRVDLRRRASLRRILAALVQTRLSTPGAAVPTVELISHGWPGERIRSDAAAGRLYVAIRSLRELGLRHTLVRQDSGYLLDPAIPVRVG